MTYKNILLDKTKYLVLFLVAFQGVLFALMAIFFTGVNYQKSWQNYNQTKETMALYLQNLSDEKQSEVYNYFSEHKELAIWTSRTKQDTSGSGLNRVYIDIMGDPEAYSSFSVYGTEVLSHSRVKELLESADNSVTIGLDDNSMKTLHPLPNLLFVTPIVIERLDKAYSDHQSIAGIYYIRGFANGTESEQFLADLSSITGLTKDELTKEMFGSHIDYGLTIYIIAGLTALTALTLLIFFLIFILRAYGKFGTLILMGWTRLELWLAMFTPFLKFFLVTFPFIGVLIWWLTGWASLSWSILSVIWGSMLLSFLLLLLTLVIPSLVLITVTILNALHKRLPDKFLVFIGFTFYGILSAALIASSYGLDGPVDQFVKNIRISEEWQNVKNMYVLRTFDEGEDIGTFAGTTNTLEASMYRMYRTIGHHDGVYLIHSEYYSSEVIDSLKNLSAKTLPSHPFWYMALSYNYLQDIGIDLSDEELSAVRNGVRLYLIPNNLSSSEKLAMRTFLEDSVEVREGDIETEFTADQRFLFKEYPVSQAVFTWSTNLEGGLTSTKPIIFVASPENLYFMESANLYVSGFNGYLKIRDKAILNQTVSDIKRQFKDLSDNQMKFTTISNYIDGLQKDLSYTFYLFGGAMLGILAGLLAVFWALVLLYQLVNQERLLIQYFLGFSRWRRYNFIIGLVLAVGLIEFSVSLVIQSKLGVLAAVVSFVSQLSMLGLSFYRQEKRILY